MSSLQTQKVPWPPKPGQEKLKLAASGTAADKGGDFDYQLQSATLVGSALDDWMKDPKSAPLDNKAHGDRVRVIRLALRRLGQNDVVKSDKWMGLSDAIKTFQTKQLAGKDALKKRIDTLSGGDADKAKALVLEANGQFSRLTGALVDLELLDIEQANAEVSHALTACALDRGPLDDWMGNASPPLNEDSAKGEQITCVRLALRWLGDPNVAASDLWTGLSGDLIKFQDKQRKDKDLASNLASLGVKHDASCFRSTGEVDRMTAGLLDLALRKNVDPPKRYRPVKAKAGTFSDKAEGPTLGRRCIAFLDDWLAQGVIYYLHGTSADSFPNGIAFGGLWMRPGCYESHADDAKAPVTAMKAHKHTNCSASTVSAFFWATRGQVNGKDLALDFDQKIVYERWIPYGDRISGGSGYTAEQVTLGAAGMVADLGLGQIIGEDVTLTGEDHKKAKDRTDSEIAAYEKKTKTKVSADKRRTWLESAESQLLHRKRVGLLKKGDLVQGWTLDAKAAAAETNSDKRNGGHSFYIVDVDAPDADGLVPGFTVITANLGGVSRKKFTWHTWMEVHIARFFEIEDEDEPDLGVA